MSIEAVKQFLSLRGLADRVEEFQVSSATVELAAAALGVEGARIAKSIALYGEQGGCMLVVCAGDCKIDNGKFKGRFGFKPRMVSFEDALQMTGHAVGGVCPFALPENVPVYLDVSLQRFDTVYPAAGSSNSAVRLTCDELFAASDAIGWEDLCRIRQEQIN